MKTVDKKGIYVNVNSADKNVVDKALKKFKKKIKDSGLMIEIKNKEFYEKPSKRKREAYKKSLIRQQIKNKNNNN